MTTPDLGQTVSTLRKLFLLYQCSVTTTVNDDNVSLTVVVNSADDNALVSELCFHVGDWNETCIVVVPASGFHKNGGLR